MLRTEHCASKMLQYVAVIYTCKRFTNIYFLFTVQLELVYTFIMCRLYFISDTVSLTTTSADNFQRTSQAGDFTVTNYQTLPSTDNIAPSKITSLHITPSTANPRMFHLTFKAVGDDLDVGRGTLMLSY